jgi:hypothetical protein
MHLEWANISFPFRARRCVFKEAVNMQNSHLISLDLEKTFVQDLDASGSKIQGSVFLCKGFQADGSVVFSGTTIEGDLACHGGRFVGNGQKWALNAGGAKIKGNVFLSAAFDAEGNFKAEESFKAGGSVEFGAATIDGNFSYSGGQFSSEGQTSALSVRLAKIRGTIFLSADFKSVGEVALVAATIDGDLICNDGHFASAGKTPALNAARASIKGSVLLCQGFEAKGEVKFTVATIAGDLVCERGQFASNGQEWALDANGSKIGGSVLLRKWMVVEGEVCFAYANITHNFQLLDVKFSEKAILNLSFTKVGRLLNLVVDGFVYDQIDDRALPEAKVQLEWLHLQKQVKFLPQPYEQLAAIFRERGLEEEARKVMIAKNDEHRRHLPAPIWDRQRPWDWVSSIFEWCWYNGLGRIIGYGFHPWNAFVISLFVICLGWFVFERGYHSKLITSTGNQVSDNWKFNSLAYSVETFVPLFKLGVSEHWTPNPNGRVQTNIRILRKIGFPKNAGSLLRYYLWLHTTAGWVLTTLWIGGLTKVIKT